PGGSICSLEPARGGTLRKVSWTHSRMTDGDCSIGERRTVLSKLSSRRKTSSHHPPTRPSWTSIVQEPASPLRASWNAGSRPWTKAEPLTVIHAIDQLPSRPATAPPQVLSRRYADDE